MRPFMGGGDMIREVAKDGISYADGPKKFEAGTPNIVQAIGFGAALDYGCKTPLRNLHSFRKVWVRSRNPHAARECPLAAALPTTPPPR